MVVVGDRVLFKSSQGTVRFLGRTEFSGGIWCGVELDDTQGKNDGSVQGVRYFDCAEAHGIFVREPMLELIPKEGISESLERKKRRQTSTGVSRAASRSASRATSRSSIAEEPMRSTRASIAVPPSRVTSESDETQRLRNIINKLQDKLQGMHSEIETLKGSVRTLEDDKATAIIRSAKLEEDFEVVSIDKETFEEQNELLRQEIEVLKEKNAQLQSELDSLKEEIQLSGDLGPSTDSDIATRNEALEEALLKLKDHAESLQEQLECALIDANKNNEIPREVTIEHNKTKEELAASLIRVKELEDIQKEAEDLEKVHAETEHELQQEIHSLEAIVGEKQVLISSLEFKNQELSEVLEKMKKENEKSVTFDFKKYEEYKMTASRLVHEKENLELDFKLLKLEVDERQKTLDMIEDSTHTGVQRSCYEMEKYAAIFKILAEAVDTNTDDLYVNILALSAKLKLLDMSFYFEYASKTIEQSRTKLVLKDIDATTGELIHFIKEQELKNLPDLAQLQDDISQQIGVSQALTPTTNLALYNCNVHKLSLQTIQDLLSKLTPRTTTNNIEQTHELTELYQLVISRMEWVQELIQRLKQDQADFKEIELSVDSLKFETSTLIDATLKKLTAIDSKTSLSSELRSFINTLNGLPSDVPEWDFQQKDMPKLAPYVMNHHTEELATKLASVQSELSEKSRAMEESTSKIQVLEARLLHMKETEQLVKRYHSEIETLQATNKDLDDRLGRVTDERVAIGKELDRLKSNNLLYNTQFESLIEQKRNVEKAELISEVEVLRRAVKHYNSAPKLERAWLKEKLPMHQSYSLTGSMLEELISIGTDVQRAASKSRCYELRM